MQVSVDGVWLLTACAWDGVWICGCACKVVLKKKISVTFYPKLIWVSSGKTPLR